MRQILGLFLVLLPISALIYALVWAGGWLPVIVIAAISLGGICIIVGLNLLLS